MTRALPVVTLVLALLALGACGYHLTGSESPVVPSTAKTITIGLFHNQSREQGLEVALRRAIEEEFRRHGVLAVVEGSDSDLSVTGAIRRFISTPAAFSGAEAVQFQGILQVSFRLRERATGKILYENKLLQESQDFGAVSSAVVTASPRFQRGTIDARDLANLTNVQLGESRRRETVDELLAAVARDIYLQCLEGF